MAKSPNSHLSWGILAFAVLLSLTIVNFAIIYSLKEKIYTKAEVDKAIDTVYSSPKLQDLISKRVDSVSQEIQRVISRLLATKVEVNVDDDPVLGDPNAKITIIEFSDFQCPFCKRFYDEALPQLQEKYIKTGIARLVYRDFPLLSIHPQALPAAIAAECADDQGKFYAMHDEIFTNQAGGLAKEQLLSFAQKIGLKMSDFTTCLENEKYKDEVLKDLDDGTAAGVEGTPAFFINGVPLSGAQPFSAFEPIIEKELKAAKK